MVVGLCARESHFLTNQAADEKLKPEAPCITFKAHPGDISPLGRPHVLKFL